MLSRNVCVSNWTQFIPFIEFIGETHGKYIVRSHIPRQRKPNCYSSAPNLPLSVGIVASLLKLIVTTGQINLALDLVAFGSLFTWAWEELFQGVNYFRRALGLIGLLGLLAWKLQ